MNWIYAFSGLGAGIALTVIIYLVLLKVVGSKSLNVAARRVEDAEREAERPLSYSSYPVFTTPVRAVFR